MDDILIIIDQNSISLNVVLSELKNTFKLAITSSSSTSHVTFLDTRIHFDYNIFNLSFYSKTACPFRLPLAADQRTKVQNKNIFISQILRMWRLSTNNTYFSMQICCLLTYLPSTGLENVLRPSLFHFLKPIQHSKYGWLSYHNLCIDCMEICYENKISIRKSLMHINKPIASKVPVSCLCSNIHFIIMYPTKIKFYCTKQMKLHDLLKDKSQISKFMQILPLCNKSINQNDQFYKKYDNIISTLPICDTQSIFSQPLFLHKVVKNFESIYGMPAKPKKKKTALNYFNSYKHAI